MFTKNISKDSHHFSWIVLSFSLFGCCVWVSTLVTNSLRNPLLFLDNVWNWKYIANVREILTASPHQENQLSFDSWWNSKHRNFSRLVCMLDPCIFQWKQGLEDGNLQWAIIKGGLIAISCQLLFQLYSALPKYLQNSGPVKWPPAMTVLACWFFQIQSKFLIFFLLCDLNKKVLLFLFNCKYLKFIGVPQSSQLRCWIRWFQLRCIHLTTSD